MAQALYPLQKEPMALSIDIVSDVVCPWCFIGKRRLGAALELYRQRRPGAPAPEIVFHPFELNPDLPREGIARADYIAKKFGARGYSAHERLTQAGAELGRPWPIPVRLMVMNSSCTLWPPAGKTVILARSTGLQALIELTVSI